MRGHDHEDGESGGWVGRGRGLQLSRLLCCPAAQHPGSTVHNQRHLMLCHPLPLPRLGAGNPDEWDRMMRINAMAPMRLVRCLAPKMADKVLRCAVLVLRWCCAVMRCTSCDVLAALGCAALCCACAVLATLGCCALPSGGSSRGGHRCPLADRRAPGQTDGQTDGQQAPVPVKYAHCCCCCSPTGCRARDG